MHVEMLRKEGSVNISKENLVSPAAFLLHRWVWLQSSVRGGHQALHLDLKAVYVEV